MKPVSRGNKIKVHIHHDKGQSLIGVCAPYFYEIVRPDKIMKKTEKKSYAYKPQFGIVVICEDELEQIKLFEMLRKKGLKLKVVVV